MLERPPHIRLQGDKTLARTHLRQAKVELYRTKQLAERMGIKTFARRVNLGDTGYIITSISPAGDYILIYDIAVPAAAEFAFEAQFARAYPCPPAFLVYQRKYAENMLAYSAQIRGFDFWTNNVEIPYDKDPLTNQYDVERRDPYGKILTYNHVEQRWRKASPLPDVKITEKTTDTFYVGFYAGTVRQPDETYNGGWWGLAELAAQGKLYGSYRRCDLVTWSGCSQNGMDVPTIVGAPDSSFFNWSANDLPSPCTASTLRPWFCFEGKTIHVRLTTDSFPRAVLGACIIPDDSKKKDYFYVLVQHILGTTYSDLVRTGQRDSSFAAIFNWNWDIGDTKDAIYRIPVEHAHRIKPNDPEPLPGVKWELVAEIPYTRYGAPKTYAQSSYYYKRHAFPCNTAYVSTDGFAYVYRTYYLPDSDLVQGWVDHYNTYGYSHIYEWPEEFIQGALLKIDLRDGTSEIIFRSDEDPNYLQWDATLAYSAPGPDYIPVESETHNFSIKTVGKGMFLNMFSGLDKLYTYRLQVTFSGDETRTRTPARQLPLYRINSGQHSASVYVVCYENDETEIARLKIEESTSLTAEHRENQLNPPYYVNEADGSASGWVRAIYYHHPKMPDRWHYTQQNYDYDFGNATANRTIYIYGGPNSTDLRSATTKTDTLVFEPIRVLGTGYSESDQNGSYSGRIGTGYRVTSWDRRGEPDLHKPANHRILNLFHSGDAFQASGNQLVGEGLISYTSSDPDYLQLGVMSAPGSSVSKSWYAPSWWACPLVLPRPYAYSQDIHVSHTNGHNLTAETDPYPSSIYNESARYFFNNPKYSVVHRPIKGTPDKGEWSYIYYLPKLYVSPDDISFYKTEIGDHPGERWPISRTSGVYFKSKGWTNDFAVGEGIELPAEGIAEVDFFSNVLTIEQIKALTGEDEDFLHGLGVM